MRTDGRSSEPSRRYHNLLYIPSGTSGTTGSSTNDLSPIEYIIYPIGLRKVFVENA